MAGMLPGVELARRRTTNHHQYKFDRSSNNSRDPHPSCILLRERLEPSTTLTETALRARTRLEKKLGGFYSRPSEQRPEQGRGSNHVIPTKVKTHFGATIFKKWSSPQLDRRNSSTKEVCSVCLDDFQAHQQIMNLSCSHKYHSDCLLPWLTVHSQCPYCRTQVQS